MTGDADWRARSRGEVRIPLAVHEVFEAFLKERFPKATPPRIESAVGELSALFTDRRRELPASYLNQPPARSAYLAYFHPLQALRGASALQEVRARAESRGLWPKEVVDVADVGAGLGAMSHALLVSLAGNAAWPRLTLVDHQKSALRDARELTTRVARELAPDVPPPSVRTVTARAEEWLRGRPKRPGPFDVVLLGGVWNEREADWEPLLERVLDVVRPGGLVVCVEPAIAGVARRLMALRDAFLDRTTTIAPCTHGVSCPLLELSRDWCFTVRKATLPRPVRNLAKRLRHQWEELRYALWAFTPGAEAAPFSHPAKKHGRVITDTMQGEQVLCVDGKRVRIPARGSRLFRGDLASR